MEMGYAPCTYAPYYRATVVSATVAKTLQVTIHALKRLQMCITLKKCGPFPLGLKEGKFKLGLYARTPSFSMSSSNFPFVSARRLSIGRPHPRARAATAAAAAVSALRPSRAAPRRAARRGARPFVPFCSSRHAREAARLQTNKPTGEPRQDQGRARTHPRSRDLTCPTSRFDK